MLKKCLPFQLFLTSKYQKENPNDAELIAKLKACLEEQVHNYHHPTIEPVQSLYKHVANTPAVAQGDM